jgi:hypothetical protein
MNRCVKTRLVENCINTIKALKYFQSFYRFNLIQFKNDIPLNEYSSDLLTLKSYFTEGFLFTLVRN